jgi:CDP-glycerol glycerophosphotransferase
MGATIALFDSWRGRYADNPRALSERMAVSHPDIRRVWVLKEGQPVPDGVRAVKPFSAAHAYYMRRADLVFANNQMPNVYRKARRTRYVQTWHGGGALKKIGWDAAGQLSERYLRNFSRDVGFWDHLLTTSPLATEVLRRAFRYDGDVIEVGHPRSDLLLEQSRPENAQKLRASLGLPADARLVLYGPTFRDRPGDPEVVAANMRTWEASLRPSDILLVRAHNNDRVLAHYTGSTSRVVNVSSYPDAQDLLAISDVLVTDYSSMFFDFAATGRPIIFFPYDLEEYRDEARGFYIDFEAEAPGPLARRVEDLVELVRDADQLPPYAEFVRKYCPQDDGHASERVLRRLLG